MENITDETARVMKLPAVKGVLVNSVVPGSTAEAAGLQRGDVWLQFNGQEINSTETGVAGVRVLREGQKFTYTYLRAGQVYQKEAVLKPFPREQYADFDRNMGPLPPIMILLRTLVTRPKQAGKRPAVLFIQGVGCYSLDSPLDTLRSETQSAQCPHPPGLRDHAGG